MDKNALQRDYTNVCSLIGEKYLDLRSVRKALKDLLMKREALVHQFKLLESLEAAKEVNPIDV